MRYFRLAQIADEICHPGREIDTQTTEVALGLLHSRCLVDIDVDIGEIMALPQAAPLGG